jgi:hypothetical protein
MAVKIAMCISGEIRNFNNHYDTYHTFREILKEHDIEIDYYGHYWEHSGEPNDKSLFKNLRCDNQDIIDSWVKEDFFMRASYLPDSTAWKIAKREQEKVTLHDHAPDEFVRKFLISSRFSYGQILSALLSFNISQGMGDYDLYWKGRWDLKPVLDLNPYNINLLKRPLNTLLGPDPTVTLGSPKWIITNGPGHAYKRDGDGIYEHQISDVHFLVSPSTGLNMAHCDPFKVLHKMVYNRKTFLIPYGHATWLLVLTQFVSDFLATEKMPGLSIQR